jgi:general secretion pathway protein E/type IV pilus assembly protein PilB
MSSVHPDNVSFISIATELQQLLTVDQAWHYSILPKYKDNAKFELFIDREKCSTEIQNQLEILFGLKIELIETETDTINRTLSQYYRKGQKFLNSESTLHGTKGTDDFLEDLIKEANSIGSSDIHFETFENICRIRLRIDGKLLERYIIKANEYPALINKIKIKSNLDIAEKRLPQDGRINYNSGNDHFDIRVSILPTLYGEKAVLRLLSKDTTSIDITRLGFTKSQLNLYLETLKKPYGIILLSGPTGSGKTTTLYATLKVLNSEGTNILTIEDPIEYALHGINQVQLKESIGLDFASALRTFLRQDPDIIMLGEIRDNETAQMAIRAALTGHMVLTTIHTNSAWGTISRLLDMGVPPFLLANTINLTIAQRLIRLLCPHCKRKVPFNPNLFPTSFKQPRILDHHFIAQGCEHCYFTGYSGRKAIYEIIPIDAVLCDQIRENAPNPFELFNERGFLSLSDMAYGLFEEGHTSLTEVYSILMNNS